MLQKGIETEFEPATISTIMLEKGIDTELPSEPQQSLNIEATEQTDSTNALLESIKQTLKDIHVQLNEKLKEEQDFEEKHQ